MRKIYPISHWFLTILFAPFVDQAITCLSVPNAHLIGGLVAVYPITIVVSITFSMPALLLSYAVFYSLKKLEMSAKFSKLVMISFSVICICITFAIFKVGLEILFSYVTTAILTGMILKIQDKKIDSK